MLLSSLYTDGLLYADELPEDRTGPLLRKPPVERCECHVIAENAEADKLVMHGYDEFRAAIPAARMRLGHGAVAVFACVNRVFASIARMTFSEEAQHSPMFPYRARHEDGRAYRGGALVSPRSRNM